MGEAPGLEPGCSVTLETTGGGVYQGVVVRFLPPGQLLVELQQQVIEVQQQQVIESQQQEVIGSQADAWMRERAAGPWKLSMCTVAATILLHALSGSRARRRRQTPSSDYFTKLAEAKDSRLQQVAGSMGVELVQLGKEADAVLARWRDYVHLETLEDLEIDVNNVRSWIAPHLEALEGMCPWVSGAGGGGEKTF